MCRLCAAVPWRCLYGAKRRSDRSTWQPHLAGEGSHEIAGLVFSCWFEARAAAKAALGFGKGIRADGVSFPYGRLNEVALPSAAATDAARVVIFQPVGRPISPPPVRAHQRSPSRNHL